jgi:cysteine desulfurase
MTLPPYIYIDHNATTPIRESAKAAYLTALNHYGNASSLHQLGQSANGLLSSARLTFAKYLHTSPEHIIFNSSGSEGNNHVLYSLLIQSLRTSIKPHVITSRIEHASIKNTLSALSQLGVEITEVPVSASGHVSLSDIEAAIQPNTRLISIILANNETGTIQPISEICQLAKSYGIPIHTDAVQALGKIPCNIDLYPVDFMTFSSHKIYAPKGTGALYVKSPQDLHALIHGGGHERELRAGTENIPGIVAFEDAILNLPGQTEWARQRSLLDFIVSELTQTISSLQIHSDHTHGLPNTLSLGIDGLDGHALAINLDLARVGVSTGSACATGSIDPSHVLEAMGVSESLNSGSIRISIGETTTLPECEHVVKSVIECVKMMQ